MQKQDVNLKLMSTCDPSIWILSLSCSRGVTEWEEERLMSLVLWVRHDILRWEASYMFRHFLSISIRCLHSCPKQTVWGVLRFWHKNLQHDEMTCSINENERPDVLDPYLLSWKRGTRFAKEVWLCWTVALMFQLNLRMAGYTASHSGAILVITLQQI